MKKMILLVLSLVLLTINCRAADSTTTVTTENGWGPSALATVGAFYLNGDYKLMQAGVAAGAAYAFGQNENVSSVGAYLGPQASQTDGKSDTSIMALIYADMFKTSAGRFGVGIGTQIWKSGDGFKGFSSSNTCLLLGYKF